MDRGPPARRPGAVPAADGPEAPPFAEVQIVEGAVPVEQFRGHLHAADLAGDEAHRVTRRSSSEYEPSVDAPVRSRTQWAVGEPLTERPVADSTTVSVERSVTE